MIQTLRLQILLYLVLSLAFATILGYVLAKLFLKPIKAEIETLDTFIKDSTLYIGFFHTGAYQDSLSGYGGTKHCLIPSPKKIIIDKDANGKLTYEVFAEEQGAESMLKVLGY